MARNTTCNLNAVPFHAVDPRIGISSPIERRNKEPLLQQLIFLLLLVCAFWFAFALTLPSSLCGFLAPPKKRACSISNNFTRDSILFSNDSILFLDSLEINTRYPPLLGPHCFFYIRSAITESLRSCFYIRFFEFRS